LYLWGLILFWVHIKRRGYRGKMEWYTKKTSRKGLDRKVEDGLDSELGGFIAGKRARCAENKGGG